MLLRTWFESVEVGTESMVLLQLERRWDCMDFYGQKADSRRTDTLGKQDR